MINKIILIALLLFSVMNSGYSKESSTEKILNASVDYTEKIPPFTIGFYENLIKIYDYSNHKSFKDKASNYSIYTVYPDKICNLYNISGLDSNNTIIVFDNSSVDACFYLSFNKLEKYVALPLHQTRVKQLNFDENFQHSYITISGLFNNNIQYWKGKYVDPQIILDKLHNANSKNINFISPQLNQQIINKIKTN